MFLQGLKSSSLHIGRRGLRLPVQRIVIVYVGIRRLLTLRQGNGNDLYGGDKGFLYAVCTASTYCITFPRQMQAFIGKFVKIFHLKQGNSARLVEFYIFVRCTELFYRIFSIMSTTVIYIMTARAVKFSVPEKKSRTITAAAAIYPTASAMLIAF